jgi:hypothetical protein
MGSVETWPASAFICVLVLFLTDPCAAYSGTLDGKKTNEKNDTDLPHHSPVKLKGLVELNAVRLSSGSSL